MSKQYIFQMVNMTKKFNGKPILEDIWLSFYPGAKIGVLGRNGSGKSTLLNLLGCLDRPTHGSYFLGDQDVAQMTDDQLSEVRASQLGFVFQSYNLIAQLSVVENIEVPLYYMGQLNSESRAHSTRLATMVGLGERLGHRPTQLSGGQQQRVAIARSLVNDPYFILADEATGNLDSVTTEEILALFQRLNDEGRTIIMVTHENEVSKHAKRVIWLKDGEVQSDEAVEDRAVFTAQRIQEISQNAEVRT